MPKIKKLAINNVTEIKTDRIKKLKNEYNLIVNEEKTINF